MNSRHPIRSRLELALTKLAFATLPRLPRGAIVMSARVLGRLALVFSPKLRRIGRANIELAYGDTRTAAEKKAILVSSFRSFALVLLDAFWFSRNSPERLANHVNFEPCFDSLFTHKAHICVTAHYGNWEVLGMAVTARGFPLHSVAKPLKNLAVDELFIEARRRTGQNIIPRRGAVRGMFKAINCGEKVALVLDQNTRENEGGRFYPFFGLPVLVATAAAGLAIKTNTDIFIGMLTPQPNGNYIGDYGRIISIEPYQHMEFEQAVDALTGEVTTALETFLREKPGHWLWMYKRWKYIPANDDARRYPFYSVPSTGN